jgi:hypothetical protein
MLNEQRLVHFKEQSVSTPNKFFAKKNLRHSRFGVPPSGGKAREPLEAELQTPSTLARPQTRQHNPPRKKI